jgi:hypothetical protein
MILENNIRIPQIISVILEGIAMFVAVLIILGQSSFTGGLGGLGATAPNAKVLPPAVIVIILHFILYLVFLIVIQNYRGRSRRGIAAFFIVVVVVISLVVPLTTTLSARLTQKLFGAAGLAALSVVSSYVSIFTVVLTAPAAVLFYISAGRYGVSKVENYEESVYQGPSYSGYTNNDQGGNQ